MRSAPAPALPSNACTFTILPSSRDAARKTKDSQPAYDGRVRLRLDAPAGGGSARRAKR